MKSVSKIDINESPCWKTQDKGQMQNSMDSVLFLNFHRLYISSYWNQIHHQKYFTMNTYHVVEKPEDSNL